MGSIAPVADNRADRCVDMREHALGLAERIGEEQARAAFPSVLAPPGVDRGDDFPLRTPAVDRQAEGRFGDERIAAQRREGRRNAVALKLIVARGDPDLPMIGDADLRRAQHMARRMERDLDPVAREPLAIGDRFDCDVAEALPQDRGRVPLTDVDVRPEPRMIAMRVRDERPRNGAPRIDVEIAGGAIEAALGWNDKVHRARGRSITSHIGRGRAQRGRSGSPFFTCGK
jgi:hypothetical protein